MLEKNTVTVRFLHLKLGQKTITQSPALSKSYDFYVAPEVRRHLDIGSVVRNINPDYLKFNGNHYTYGVVVDNFNDLNSQKEHRAIKNVYPGGHLRSFIEDHFSIPRNHPTTKEMYQAFRVASHPYWVRLHQNKH